MNRDEILDILLGRSGGAWPDRGVRGDDILLGRYVLVVGAGGMQDFWQSFAKAFKVLWQECDVDAIEPAAAFVSGLASKDKPSADDVGSLFSFLLDDLAIIPDVTGPSEARRQTVAGMRLLANFGLGDRNWWRKRFLLWMDYARSAAGTEGRLAWQAVLHTTQGLMNSMEPVPRINAWLEGGRKAKEFPAIELFTLLSRQTDYQANKEDLKSEVVEAFQSLYVNCLRTVCPLGNLHGDCRRDDCPQGIVDLRSVIETWFVDRLKIELAEAERLLKWREPSRELPQVRLAARKRQLTGAHT